VATIQPNVDYMIVNYNSGLAWAVQGENTASGTSVVQYSWQVNPGQLNQRWNFVQAAGGWNIKTPDSFNGFYAAIDVSGFGGDNNVGVNVYSPWGVTRDVWTISSDQIGDWVTITNVATGMNCAVQGESTANDACVVQYSPIAQAGQLWMILPYNDSTP
jgi:hypothetical protein